MKLGLAVIIGILFVMAGITGKLGSMLAAIIDPSRMREI